MNLRLGPVDKSRAEHEPPRAHDRYFDDEAWPVQLAIAGLGTLLIALLARQQPGELSQWPTNAWITIGSFGLATIAAMAGATFIDPRIVRRPLQLALVLCLIVHALMVVQMVHARLENGGKVNLVPSRENEAHFRPTKIADYRPIEHLPEESRPRQDFERPVDVETPLPVDDWDSVIRQKLEHTAPVAAADSSADRDNETKPEAAQLERKSLDARPEVAAIEMAEAPRDLTDIQTQVSPTVELPVATAETLTTSPEVTATRAEVDRQQIPLASGPRRSEINDPARPSAPLPEIVVDNSANSRRRIPTHERPSVGDVTDTKQNISRRASSNAIEPQPLETVELPANPEATIRQAMRDHQPLASIAARTQLNRTPLAPRSGSSTTPIDPAANASDQPLRPSSPSASQRSAPTDGPSLIPDELAAIARPSRSVAAPAAVRSVVPKEAFSARSARLQGGNPVQPGSSIIESEDAIERGLVFLARHQRGDGSWSLQGFPEDASLVSDTAATALAIMAFQGAGYNHRELAYHDAVSRGLMFLLSRQRANGDLFVPLDDASNKSVWLYSHALATIAVCEAYGMTQDASLREPAQKAIDFIVAGQQKERGGWRYAPGINSDTSVSGWMTMALKSGELAGLAVPPAVYDKIRHWLDTAQQSSSAPYFYCYNPYAPDSPEQRHGRAASKTMTAVGLLMRLYTGWRRDDPNFGRGAAYFLANLPAEGNARQNERDTYYWYYATQVLAQVGGENWQVWSERLQPLLVKSQIRRGEMAGSWDPLLPIADHWGPQAGRLYVTVLNLLSLEVEYRKLPVSGASGE
jgi:hypothetical protein